MNKKIPDSLIIKHFAGEVQYSVNGFIEKNDDQLNNDIVDALELSKNKLIKYLFKKNKEEKEKNGPNKLHSDTLSKQFKKQLDELIKMLTQSNPRYIKCIKPNNSKKSGMLESIDVNRQILCAGILEAIKIRNQGFSIRRTHEEFVMRYRPIVKGISLPNSNTDYSKTAQEIVKFVQNSKDFNEIFQNNKKIIQVGLTKILMKDEVKTYLESKLIQVQLKSIIKIQSLRRGLKIHKKHKTLRAKSIKIQKYVKGFILREKFKNFINRLILQVVFDGFMKKRVFYLINPVKDQLTNYFKEKKKKKEEAEKKAKDEKEKTMQRSIEKSVYSSNETKKKEEAKAKDEKVIQRSMDKSMYSSTEMNNFLNHHNQDKQHNTVKPRGEADDYINYQIKESEFIAKIEVLSEEKFFLKNENLNLKEQIKQLKEVIVTKDNEIAKIKSNVFVQQDNNYNNTLFDESLRLQVEFLEENMRFEKKSSNEHELQLLEDELKKLKNVTFEKDTQIYSFNLQVSELTKSNKYLQDLCENLKNQIKKNKEKLDNEFQFFFDQKREFEKEKNEYHSKISENKTNYLMEKQIVELKNENKLLSTKSVENRKRNEKEIEAYKKMP